MKKSFVTKIFSGVFTLLLIVFIVQFIFQSVIFPYYFLHEVRNNIEESLTELVDSTNNELYSNLHDFSENTQTVSTLLSKEDLSIINSKRLSEVTVDSDGTLYNINFPMMFRINVRVGDKISGTFIKNPYDRYLPITLYLNGEKIYGGMMNGMRSRHMHSFEQFDIEGIVQSVKSGAIQNQDDVTFSEEIVNLSTGNITEYKELNNGITYISEDINGNENLVYVTNLNLEGSNILLTTYSLNNIKLISRDITTFNIITYFSAFIILIILSLIYIKRISIPLKKINEKTKKLSNLEFETSLEDFETNDEIGELSRSINILSTNLKTTLNELNEKNTQLSKGIEREIERDKLRKDFVTGVSHELKTPLAVIQASAEGLSLNIFESKEERKEQFSLIEKEINRTNRLISNMMEIYKLEQNEYKSTWENINLEDIILRVNDRLKKLAEVKNIETSLNLKPYYIEGDILKLELVISNLYSNAIKYTKSGETITINLDESGFEIINTGVTIPDDSINNLFEPFFRVDKSKQRKDESTGLGLYIVKQILDQHELNYGIVNHKNAVKFYIKK